MTNDEIRTKPEEAAVVTALCPVRVSARPATGRWLQHSSFVLSASFVICHFAACQSYDGKVAGARADFQMEILSVPLACWRSKMMDTITLQPRGRDSYRVILPFILVELHFEGSLDFLVERLIVF